MPLAASGWLVPEPMFRDRQSACGIDFPGRCLISMLSTNGISCIRNLSRRNEYDVLAGDRRILGCGMASEDLEWGTFQVLTLTSHCPWTAFFLVYSYSHATYNYRSWRRTFYLISCPQSARWRHVASPFALRLGRSQEDKVRTKEITKEK